MNTIKDCFEMILWGNEAESRLAAREITKLLYRPGRSSKYKEIQDLIDAATASYDKITEDWRQKNFAVAVSVIYFLHDKEAEPDFLFPWLFRLLLHANGVIRYAAVRMFTNELGPLTVYIRIPGFKPGNLTYLKPERAETILFSLFANLNKLLESEWLPAYKKYKYISSLPKGPYKSAQMVLARMEELCGNEHMEQYRQNRLYSN